MMCTELEREQNAVGGAGRSSIVEVAPQGLPAHGRRRRFTGRPLHPLQFAPRHTHEGMLCGYNQRADTADSAHCALLPRAPLLMCAPFRVV